MASKNYKTVSLRVDHYDEYAQLAAEMTVEEGSDVTVAKAIYRAKQALKEARKAKKLTTDKDQ